MGKDLYKIPGISRNAGDQEIRAAYLTLAKKFHPDIGAGSSEEKFLEIQDAYETLADPARRAAYDWELRQTVSGSVPVKRAWPPGRQQSVGRKDRDHLDLSDIFTRPHAEPPRTGPLVRLAADHAHLRAFRHNRLVIGASPNS